MIVYRDAKRRGKNKPLFTDPEGDICFSIYQISLIKMKKVIFFLNSKRQIVGSLSTIYKHFGDFYRVRFYDFVANSPRK